MSIVPVTFDAKNPNVGVVHTDTEQGALLYTNALSPLLDNDVKWVTIPEDHPFAAGRRVNKMNPAILGTCPMCQQSGCIEAQTDSSYTNEDGEQIELMVLHCLTTNQFAFT
tara:strand:+ start:293 stop:625 length:333 start_codon:yes stop_codon:yes gene_type:complete